MDALNKPKVLLVEDDSFLSSLLRLKLEKSNYEITHAADGQQALDILLNFKPDLILLDLILPKKNGFEVLEAIRQNPLTEKIPVIIISNLGQESDVTRGKSLGIIDYFIKAKLSIDDLVLRVAETLKQIPVSIPPGGIL
ncbi:MAG: response regulator [Candidatus Parcubacteria bacterium]|nr:response regulator [Candidatus Parcubacteria bacterium]